MLINLRNALMTGKRLPYDAEVEYLESSGTQWIDTGRPIPADFWFDATIDITGTNGAYKTLLGARISTGNQDYQFSFQGANNSFLARYGTNSQQYFGTQQTGMMRIRVKSGGRLYIDESSIQQLGVGSPSTLNMYIFALNNNGVASQQAQYIRLYSLKYGGLNEDHDFIPVRKGTVGYLYDRVSGKLFGNAGTGDFVLGPDVVPVEYIESTGAEWIDTATPTADKYTFECLFTNATKDIKLFGNSYAYGRYRDLSIYQSQYRGTSIATSSNEWDRIEIDVAQPRLTVTRSGSTVGSATSWWSAYTGATPDTQYGTALPLGGHINQAGIWYGTNRVTCFYREQGVRIRTRLFESWLGSELIEKLIPIRVGTSSTWKGAMMDVLTRRIYRNAGTGAFAYGNDLKYPIPAA